MESFESIDQPLFEIEVIAKEIGNIILGEE